LRTADQAEPLVFDQTYARSREAVWIARGGPVCAKGMARARATRVLSRWKAILFIGVCGWLPIFDQHASGALVDWDVLTWTPGALSNSFDVDPSHLGNDVSISIETAKTTFTNDKASNVLTPAITSSLQGGVSPLQKSLELAANLGTNSKITMTVMFSPLYTLGVNNVTFSIFDIDLETNHDQISGIYGIAMNGTKVAPTVTVGSAITVNGSGLGTSLLGNLASPDTGPGSGAGTATISFGATPIKGFVFSWSNTNGSPFYQQIAIGDISYSIVPEMNPAVAVALLCASAAGLERRRRRTRRS
jgi:hypothetical protein